MDEKLGSNKRDGQQEEDPTRVYQHLWSTCRRPHQSCFSWEVSAIQGIFEDYKLRGGVKYNL